MKRPKSRVLKPRIGNVWGLDFGWWPRRLRRRGCLVAPARNAAVAALLMRWWRHALQQDRGAMAGQGWTCWWQLGCWYVASRCGLMVVDAVAVLRNKKVTAVSVGNSSYGRCKLADGDEEWVAGCGRSLWWVVWWWYWAKVFEDGVRWKRVVCGVVWCKGLWWCWLLCIRVSGLRWFYNIIIKGYERDLWREVANR